MTKEQATEVVCTTHKIVYIQYKGCHECLADKVRKIDTLFDIIKHGDEEHQRWLKETIEKHFNISIV